MVLVQLVTWILIIHWCVDAESVLPVGGIEDDGVRRVLLDETRIDHLTHELCRRLVVVGSLFSIIDSSSQLCQFNKFCCLILLFELSLFLVSSNLSYRASSFAAYLQHVSTLSLRHYRKINLVNDLKKNTYMIRLWIG